MKRVLSLLLIPALIFSLVSCGPSLAPEEAPETQIRTAPPTETAEEAVSGVHEVTGFCVGFGREDITPEDSVPLSGYGNVLYRMSARVLDPLYSTCVALQDENGERLLIFQLDIINTGASLTDSIRYSVEKATGVPGDHMLINATHTHSGPAYSASDPAPAFTWAPPRPSG